MTDDDPELLRVGVEASYESGRRNGWNALFLAEQIIASV
jgi:hypothetical protein